MLPNSRPTLTDPAPAVIALPVIVTNFNVPLLSEIPAVVPAPADVLPLIVAFVNVAVLAKMPPGSPELPDTVVFVSTSVFTKIPPPWPRELLLTVESVIVNVPAVIPPPPDLPTMPTTPPPLTAPLSPTTTPP